MYISDFSFKIFRLSILFNSCNVQNSPGWEVLVLSNIVLILDNIVNGKWPLRHHLKRVQLHTHNITGLMDQFIEMSNVTNMQFNPPLLVSELDLKMAGLVVSVFSELKLSGFT